MALLLSFLDLVDISVEEIYVLHWGSPQVDFFVPNHKIVHLGFEKVVAALHSLAEVGYCLWLAS